MLGILSELLRTCDFSSWALGFLITSEAGSCTLGSVDCCLSSVYEPNRSFYLFIYFKSLKYKCINQVQVKIVADKTVCDWVQYPKVVVPPIWILLSFFFFVLGFFLPCYFHSSFQRTCYTQPAKGICLLEALFLLSMSLIFLSNIKESKLWFGFCNAFKISFPLLNAGLLIGWF